MKIRTITFPITATIVLLLAGLTVTRAIDAADTSAPAPGASSSSDDAASLLNEANERKAGLLAACASEKQFLY